MIQLNRRLQHLFIALLLACFAIAQSARAKLPGPDRPPEKIRAIVSEIKESRNLTMFIPCAGEDVELHFSPFFLFVRSDGDVRPHLQLERFHGIGKTTGRKYVLKRHRIRVVKDLDLNGLTIGEFTVELVVAGIPNPPPQGDPNPGKVVEFKLFYTETYEAGGKNVAKHEVSAPESCCNPSPCFFNF